MAAAMGFPAVPEGSPASDARSRVEAPDPIFHANATWVASWYSFFSRASNAPASSGVEAGETNARNREARSRTSARPS
jgi:hypothetical protein